MRFARALSAAALLLAGCNENTSLGNDREAQIEPAPTPAPVLPPAAALRNVAPGLIKPETMSNADIAALGGLAGRCVIRLTEVAHPSFLFEPGGAGAIKLNGKLIPLQSAGEGRFAAGGLSVILRPQRETGDAGLQAMNMIVVPPEAKDELGYAGFVRCYNGEEA